MGKRAHCLHAWLGAPTNSHATAVHCRNVSVRRIMTLKGGVLKVDRFTAVGIMLWREPGLS